MGGFQLVLCSEVSLFSECPLSEVSLVNHDQCFPLSPSLELGEVEHARKYYHSTGDVAGTLFRMPKARYVERQLLLGLQKHAVVHNYLGAFNFVR